jgi:hypothetical protein
VRYNHAEKGVKVKVSELVNLGDETSELLYSYVLEVLQKLDLLEHIGCPAHVIHNAVQTAAYGLPIDLQLIIKKIYQHFHIYCVRVEELKSFANSPIESIKLFWATARQGGSLSCLQSREL